MKPLGPPPPPPPPLPQGSGKLDQEESTTSAFRLSGIMTKVDEAQVMFLGKFMDRPMLKSEIKYYGVNKGWADALRIDPFTLVQRLEAAGLITSLSPERDVKRMLDAFATAAKLKEALGRAGAKKTGKKSDLVDRLIESCRDEASALIPQEACWGITNRGAGIIDSYRIRKKAEKEDIEDKLLTLILGRLHPQAATLRAEYNSRQVFPPGLGCDWDNWDARRDVEILNAIRELTPDALADRSAVHLELARIMASFHYLCGSQVSARLRRRILADREMEHPEEDDNLESDVRRLLNFAYGKVNLDEWKEMSFKFVKILSCGGESCKACQEISKKKYPISEVPQLPHVACTDPRGCRCCYVTA
jgi:hypothetical protein